jgi:serine/threonine-protein kinase RsbT
MTTKSERLDIRSSDDVVRAGQLARTMATAAGLSHVDQTKIVTAASELARNTLDCGGGGFVLAELIEAVGLHMRLSKPMRRNFSERRVSDLTHR